MDKLSVKNQERVLDILIRATRQNSNEIEVTRDFVDKFTFVDRKSLIQILLILQSEGYIDIVYSDFSGETHNSIRVLPSGFAYKPRKIAKNKEWLCGYAAGVVSAVVAEVLIKLVSLLFANML